MQKTDIRRNINVEKIGFNPDRMKAVHIANGFFLQILGFYYPTDLINRLTVFERKGPGRPTWRKHDTNFLLQEEVLQNKLPPETTLEILSKLRYHINQHLDADNGVYDHDDSSGCAYSGASKLLVTPDRDNDGFGGNFLAMLLDYDFGNGSSPLIKKIRDALEENSDPISAIATVLTPDEEQSKEYNKSYASKERQHFDALISGHPQLKSLRLSLDRLAAYYPERVSAQRFLRLLVILGGLTLVRYLISLYETETRCHPDNPNYRLALLIDAQQNNASRVRISSQASYSRVINALPSLYGVWLGDWLKQEVEQAEPGEDLSQASLIATYDKIIKASKGSDKKYIFPGDAVVPALLNEPNLTIEQVATLAGEHMATNLLRRRSEDDFLSGFVREIGVRCGLIKPRAAQQRRKHIDPQADTLEALVMALVDHERERKGVRVEIFAERLWETYGLLFGGMEQGVKDLELLSDLGIQSANRDDLVVNSSKFIDRLEALGLARRYADGYDVVQYP